MLVPQEGITHNHINIKVIYEVFLLNGGTPPKHPHSRKTPWLLGKPTILGNPYMYTLYPLPCLTFVSTRCLLHGRLNQLLCIAGVLAMKGDATPINSPPFKGRAVGGGLAMPSTFTMVVFRIPVLMNLIGKRYQSIKQVKQVTGNKPTCFFLVCFFVGSIWLPNWTGQSRQPVLTPSILDHKIHQRTTMRSSSRCGTGVDTLDHRCCGQLSW